MNVHKPTISLCMIVKDEADYLPTCLESVRGFVDEIIIVDTGSTDDTVAIAEAAGAKVHSFNWTNDFAVARNESLRHATSEWILYLDADERLDDVNKSKITTLLLQHPDAIALNMRVVIPQPKQNIISGFSLDYCRMFRNLPDIRFEIPVHEQIIPSILRMGGKILKTDVTIDHWGFGMKQHRRDNRNERNVRLLEAEVAKNPRDAFIHYHLAITYRTVGKIDSAIRHFEMVISLNDLKPALMANTSMFLAQLYLTKENWDQAQRECERALSIAPSEAFPYYMLATIALSRDDVQTAIRHLKTIITMKKTRPDYQAIADIDMAQVYLDLGNCHFQQENFQEARLNYEKGLIQNPDSVVGNFYLGKCHLQLDQPKSAAKWFERVLELDPSLEAARNELLECYEYEFVN
jgi:glycosyltransferase involved in cell wall biosynthesis